MAQVMSCTAAMPDSSLTSAKVLPPVLRKSWLRSLRAKGSMKMGIELDMSKVFETAMSSSPSPSMSPIEHDIEERLPPPAPLASVMSRKWPPPRFSNSRLGSLRERT